MTEIVTPYGNVVRSPNATVIHADRSQLYRWAHRPHSSWPCSELADLNEIQAAFDYETGDLFDLNQDPDGEDYAIPADEFNAWTEDVFQAEKEINQL